MRNQFEAPPNYMPPPTRVNGRPVCIICRFSEPANGTSFCYDCIQQFRLMMQLQIALPQPPVGPIGPMGPMGPKGEPGRAPTELVDMVSEAIDRIDMQLRKLEPAPKEVQAAVDDLKSIFRDLVDNQ